MDMSRKTRILFPVLALCAALSLSACKKDLVSSTTLSNSPRTVPVLTTSLVIQEIEEVHRTVPPVVEEETSVVVRITYPFGWSIGRKFPGSADTNAAARAAFISNKIAEFENQILTESGQSPSPQDATQNSAPEQTMDAITGGAQDAVQSSVQSAVQDQAGSSGQEGLGSGESFP